MKMLYILNIAKRVNNFSYTSMIAAKECGIEYHIAGNWAYENNDERASDEEKYGIKIHQIDFVRKPYSLKNHRAYKQLLELCKKEKYDVIHCNTPIGGFLGRLVGSKVGVKKIIYQAHGFHFYKGASLVNWLLYYPIEKWLAHKTDVLITINKEDFAFAKKKMRIKKGGTIEYVPGVGIDVEKYKRNDEARNAKRLELGVGDDDIVVLSAGDLVKRKNYLLSIDTISRLNNQRLQYFICGLGPEEKRIKRRLRKKRMEGQIHLLGYRKDILELYNASDVFLFTSKQEGLARSLMEAMASGVPCVVSNIRGNSDLIGSNNEMLCNLDINSFSNNLGKIVNDKTLRDKIGKENYKMIHRFDLQTVVSLMKKIYLDVGEKL